MYYGAEFQAADARVDVEAPGLGTYLDSRGDYYLPPEVVKELGEAATNEQTHSDVACALLTNLLMHREAAKQIERGVYDEAVREGFARVAQCQDSPARLREVKALREWFKEMFDPEEPPPPPQGGGDDEDEQEPQDQDEQEQEPQEGDDEQDGKPEDGGDDPQNGDQGDDDGEGNPDDDGQPEDGDQQDGDGAGDGDQEGENGKPKLSDHGKPIKLDKSGEAIDAELSLIQGEVEGNEEVQAAIQLAGEDQGLDEGEECPAVGWADEVEPWTVRSEQAKPADGYAEVVSAMTAQIRALVNKLQFTTDTPHVHEYGYRSGELDEGGIDKLFMGDRNPAVFMQTEVFERPPISVGIMVDESGSMSSNHNYEQARKVAVLLTEAFAQVAGVRIRVWGHSTDWGDTDTIVYEYVTATNGGLANKSRLAGISARSGNYDGAALGFAADQLALHDADCDRRILFCISDGLPGGGEDGVTFNRYKAEQARRNGVEVYGIGVQNAYDAVRGAGLFGPNMFCVLDDVESAGAVISSFIVRMVNRRV
jgi:hypothetical protein